MQATLSADLKLSAAGENCEHRVIGEAPNDKIDAPLRDRCILPPIVAVILEHLGLSAAPLGRRDVTGQGEAEVPKHLPLGLGHGFPRASLA